jgi:hypothetical protein
MKRTHFVAILLMALLWRAIFFGASSLLINVSGDESIMGLQAIGITQPADSELFQTKQQPRGLFGRFPLLFMAQPYLFPLESYLSAPFIRWLPRTAFGLRLTPAILGGAAALFMLLLMAGWHKRDRGVANGWFLAVMLSAAFPGAYVLTLQSVYMLPS